MRARMHNNRSTGDMCHIGMLCATFTAYYHIILRYITHNDPTTTHQTQNITLNHLLPHITHNRTFRGHLCLSVFTTLHYTTVHRVPHHTLHTHTTLYCTVHIIVRTVLTTLHYIIPHYTILHCTDTSTYRGDLCLSVLGRREGGGDERKGQTGLIQQNLVHRRSHLWSVV